MKNNFECFKIIQFLLTFSIAHVLSVQPRSVNLALETTFLFDTQDIKENTTFINNVQSIMDKLKTALNQNTPVFRQQHNTELLTKFLTEIGISMIKFDDTDIQKFVQDLNDVMKTHVVKNDVFNEIFADDKMKLFLKNTVKEYLNADPMKTKVDIARCVLNDEVNPTVLLFRVLNKFYEESDDVTFKKLLRKFTKAKKSKNFAKFFKKAVTNAVFRPYKKLNALMKQVLIDELKKYADSMSKDGDRVNDDKIAEAEPSYRRLSLSKIAKAESFSESSRESFEISKSIERTKPETTTQNNVENEIIINKDLQMDVRSDGNIISVI